MVKNVPVLAHKRSEAGLEMRQAAGLAYDPLLRRWSLTADLAVNYIAYAAKQPAAPRSPP